MIETEVKIKIGDADAVREQLLAWGACIRKERFHEENTLYDFPDGSLYEKKQALRFRVIDKKAFVTFKGSPRKSRSFKIREEFESEVRNGPQFKKLLKAVGLKPVFEYRKHRTFLAKGPLKICLDETHVGNYLELEGKRSDITRAAKALGFSRRDFITLDYVELFRRAEKASRAG